MLILRGPDDWILDNIGNVSIILLLLKHHHNACSIYVTGAAVMKSVSVYLYSAVYIDPTQNSLIFCKLHNFLAHAWDQRVRYFIVLACLDYHALTNGHARVRALRRPSIVLSMVNSTKIPN